jgi:hypothetical protein
MAMFCPGALGLVDDDANDEDEPESAGLFCPGALGFADDEDEPESGGFADATQGVAAIPTPTPSATANAPTRPTYLADPAAVYFVSLMVVPPSMRRNEPPRARRHGCGLAIDRHGLAMGRIQ